MNLIEKYNNLSEHERLLNSIKNNSENISLMKKSIKSNVKKYAESVPIHLIRESFLDYFDKYILMYIANKTRLVDICSDDGSDVTNFNGYTYGDKYNAYLEFFSEELDKDEDFLNSSYNEERDEIVLDEIFDYYNEDNYDNESFDFTFYIELIDSDITCENYYSNIYFVTDIGLIFINRALEDIKNNKELYWEEIRQRVFGS